MTNLNREQNTELAVEALESRQMLSTVSIDAAGFTGEEIMVVTAADVEVFSATVSEDGGTFTFDVEDSIEVTDLKVNFVNDFFDPGVKDRNLIVREIRFDGIRYNPRSLSVFSTGTWLAEDGVEDGFGRDNILHSNGYFQVAASDTIEFDGNVWNTSRPLSGENFSIDTTYNELLLSGVGGEDFSISRQIDIVPNELSVLRLDAWRDVISGSFGDAGVGAGIDFYDVDGNKITSFETLDNVPFQVNDNSTNPSDRILENQIRVPSNATTAFLWVWVQGQDAGGSNIPLRLTSLELEPATIVGDTQPPTAIISTFSAARDNFFVFSVAFRDETALPGNPDVIGTANAIEVVDPEGRVITPTFDSTTPFGSTSQSVTFLVNGQSSGAPSVLVPGDYEIRLLGGTIPDAAGNFAVEQSLGIVSPFAFGQG